MITISYAAAHKLLGILHVGASLLEGETQSWCACQSIGTYGCVKHAVNDVLGDTVHEIAMEEAFIRAERIHQGELYHGATLPGISRNGCVPVRILLEIIEEMIKEGEVIIEG